MLNRFFLLLLLLPSLAGFAQQQKANTDPSKVSLETMPVFPGGQEALVQYMNANLTTPLNNDGNPMSGEVIVSFIVSKTGKVGNVLIQKGANATLDSAAINAVRSMPDWAPGTKLGQPVDAMMTLPVIFNAK